MATTPFTTFAFPGSSRPTSRTTPDRIADVFNVKDYGALGDFSHDDTANIQACFNAASTGGTIFFPPGGYKLLSNIGINIAAGGNRIIGAGRNATSIEGTVSNGFLFYQLDGTNGPSEIAHLSFTNISQNIGSGALMISNSSAHIHDCSFRGQIGILLPFNIYDMVIECCGGVPNEHLIGGVARTGNGYNGTLMVAGYAPHIIGWRSTGPCMTGFQLQGSNGCSLIGNGIEGCEEGMILGMATGWASDCTTAGTVLTVGGTIGAPSENYFTGAQVWATGLTLKPWNTDPTDPAFAGTWIIGDHNTDGTLTGTGGAGTYRLNRAAPVDITTPVPMWTRFNRVLSSVTIAGYQNEACWVGLFVNQIGTSNIMSAGGNCALGEAIDQWAQEGTNAHSGFWINSAGNSTFSGCAGSNNTTHGSFYLDPAANANGNTTFSNCQGVTTTDNTVTASISNGASGAGTILNITALSGSGVAIGMPIDPAGSAGVTSGTVITGNVHTEPGVLTGYAGTGTYRVNNSQLVSSTTMTIPFGKDWALPPASGVGTGLRFENCATSGAVTGLKQTTVFSYLPGQSNASSFIPIDGVEYSITDGQKSGTGTAAFGDTVVGGGSQHIKVRYNGTNWTRCG